MCSKCFKEEQESKGVTSKPTASVSNAAPAGVSDVDMTPTENPKPEEEKAPSKPIQVSCHP